MKGRNNFLCNVYFFIHLVKPTDSSFCLLTSFPDLYSSTILFLSSLCRSCKLQIRNIPPHMQWEVSANRLLTASRVAHYRDSRPGSCSGVWSHLPLPSFGFLLWAAWWFVSERAVRIHVLSSRWSSDWKSINYFRMDLVGRMMRFVTKLGCVVIL